MSVLVTGSAGFIGYHVCRLLLEQGETVVGADNVTRSYDVRVKEWRLRRLESRPGYSFKRVDVSDREQMRSLFANGSDPRGAPFSAVVSLAARAGVRASVEDPWAYYATNTLGTLNLLDLCREYGVGKFVLASTSGVYGDDTPSPFREDSAASQPLSPYGSSKKAAETLVYPYHHLHGLDATVLRYFTVYGPAGRPDMSVFAFIRAIAEGKPITVLGDGTQERDFTYVDDVARGTIAALKPLGYKVINLGNSRPVVLNDMIKMVEDRLGCPAQRMYSPAHPADTRSTRADIGRAWELLGWRPQVPIEEGISRTVSWYEENREWAKELV